MPITPDTLKQAINVAYNDTTAAIDRVHGPLWEARADAVRNLVSVSAAILAGTIVFLSDLLPPVQTYGFWALAAS